MGDVLPNSVCSKCGAKNTLERDGEGTLHCWACGTDQGKNPDAVALGRLGGAKGGKARSGKLTPERRTEIARNAVNARWAKGKMNHRQIMERHKFYEDNKQAILADVQSIGRTATCRKWNIPSGSLSILLRRWQEESRGKPPPPPPPPPGHNSDIILPELPAFSNDWTPEVQLKWLEVYDKLMDIDRYSSENS
jgi:hypothetical protein